MFRKKYVKFNYAPVYCADKCIIIFTQFYHILTLKQVFTAPF